MRQLIERAARLVGLALIVALPGAADMPSGAISAFNQAVQSGDPATIVTAAKQMGATAVAHPEDPQAPVAAFEAANQLCLRGACADAVPMAAYLSGLEDGLPVSRADVDVLTAFANWSASAKNKAADQAFSKVLEAQVDSHASMLTLAAYEYFCAALIGSEDWAGLHERAQLAKAHMKQARDVVPYRWATIASLSASSLFNEERSTDALQEMADIKTWLYQKRIGEGSKDLDKIYYNASAWQIAMKAYFRSGGGRDDRIARRIDDAVTTRMEEINQSSKVEPSDGPSLCKGHVVSPPRPMYPRKAARKGYVGAVLMSFGFDDDGKPAHFRVLASVPDGKFEQASLDGMKSLEWEWDAQQEDPDCTKSREEAGLYPFEYVLR
jgi:hypothetical protein